LGKAKNYLACDVEEPLVGICTPSCVRQKAAASIDRGDDAKEEKEDGDDAKPMKDQHPLNNVSLNDCSLKVRLPIYLYLYQLHND